MHLAQVGKQPQPLAILQRLAPLHLSERAWHEHETDLASATETRTRTQKSRAGRRSAQTPGKNTGRIAQDDLGKPVAILRPHTAAEDGIGRKIVECAAQQRDKGIQPLDLQVFLAQGRRGADRGIDRGINTSGQQNEDGNNHDHFEEREGARVLSHGW